MALSARAQDALGIARDELKKLASTFEIFYTNSQSLKIESRDQKIDTLTRSQDMGLSIRLLDEGRMGFSFTTSVEPEAIRRAARSAREVAQVMEADPLQSLGGFGSADFRMPFDHAGLAVSVDDKARIALDLEARCRAADPRIRGVRSAGFSESSYEVALLSHEDRPLDYASARFSVSIAAKAEEKGDAQMGYDFAIASDLAGLDVPRVATRAAHRATRLLNADKTKTGRRPAIIENAVVAELLEFLSSSFSGDEIEKGKSILKGKLSEKIFNERIHILDDGLLPGGVASRPFDAEGTPSRTTNLVQAGVFSSPILDRYYAKKLGLKSTGNASRGVQSPPDISTTNLYLKPGRMSLPELMKSMGNGLFITNLLGVHTANAVTGSFSLGASGILVENGQLTRPVKGFAVAGNIFDLFRDLSEIGSDLEFFGGKGAPAILVPGLAVSGE